MFGSPGRMSAQWRICVSIPDHGTDLTLINAPWALEVGKQWDVLYGESLWGQPWSLFDVRCRSSRRAANSRVGVRGGEVVTGVHADKRGRHRVHRPGIWLLRHARVADARTYKTAKAR